MYVLHPPSIGLPFFLSLTSFHTRRLGPRTGRLKARPYPPSDVGGGPVIQQGQHGRLDRKGLRSPCISHSVECRDQGEEARTSYTYEHGGDAQGLLQGVRYRPACGDASSRTIVFEVRLQGAGAHSSTVVCFLTRVLPTTKWILIVPKNRIIRISKVV
jgi:hypothetical protein